MIVLACERQVKMHGTQANYEVWTSDCLSFVAAAWVVFSHVYLFCIMHIFLLNFFLLFHIYFIRLVVLAIFFFLRALFAYFSALTLSIIRNILNLLAAFNCYNMQLKRTFMVMNYFMNFILKKKIRRKVIYQAVYRVYQKKMEPK